MNVRRSSLEIRVDDLSQIGEARRAVPRLGERAGLSASIISDAAIIVSEFATNLLHHAGGGSLILRTDGSRAIEIHSIDTGGGMDLDRCITDGYSTAGTAGNGLGAVRRLAVEFDAFSSAQGTVLWARAGAPAPDRAVRIGAINLCHPAELVSGDDWDVCVDDDQVSAMLVDGLGHGPHAADAACSGTMALSRAAPAEVLRLAHGRMAGTRGGAAACAQLGRNDGSLVCASVGNIGAALVSAERGRGLPAQNGTLGAHFPARVHETRLDYRADNLFVLHSDGIASRWSLDRYPGLVRCHPAVVAGVLLRDFRRRSDDATVLVLQCAEAA